MSAYELPSKAELDARQRAAEAPPEPAPAPEPEPDSGGDGGGSQRRRSSPSVSLPGNKTGARKAVLVSAAAMVIISIYRSKSSGQGSLYKELWGIGVIFVLLSMLADFAPGIAGPFAVLIVLGKLTNKGDQAITNLLSTVGSKVTVPATAATAAKPAVAK